MNHFPSEPKKEMQSDYSDTLWLRATVSLIPYIGGSLDLILSHRAGKLAKLRAEKLLAELRTEMEQAKETSIRREFLESDEWTDLVRLAVERGARIRDTSHLRAIARILKGIATDEISTSGHAEDLIDVVAALKDEEALILREIYERFTRGQDKVQNYGEELEEHVPSPLRRRVPFLLKRLEALGLITETTGAFYDYGGGEYGLTPTGKELCAYLRQPQ